MNLSSYLDQDQSFDNLFSLTITQKNTSTKIIMQLHRNEVNTSHLPFIVDLLKMNLPNVLATRCFNDENLPFREEVRNTEIGHLFEHILLEYLCQFKIAKGFSRASYAGRTRWNWIKDPRGKFHIHLNCGSKDSDILPLAIDKTVSLMKFILLEEQQAMLFDNKLNRRYFRLSQKNGLKNGKRIRP